MKTKKRTGRTNENGVKMTGGQTKTVYNRQEGQMKTE